MYRHILYLLFPVLSCFTAHAQNYEKKFVLTLPDTTACALQRLVISMGEDDYCYYYHGTPLLLNTPTKKYGPFSEVECRALACHYYNTKGQNEFIRYHTGYAVYGPYNGKIYPCNTSDRNDMGYVVHNGDSVYYYINGVLLSTNAYKLGLNRDWCEFSKNGNVIYTLKMGGWNYLYANGKLLDSTKNNYVMLRIDDRNNYSYALSDPAYGSRYKTLPHKPQNLFSPIDSRTSYFSYDDTVNYYGNADGLSLPSFRPYDRRGENCNIITKGSVVFSYASSELRTTSRLVIPDTLPSRICVNGVCRDLPYEKIVMTCFDSSGHYALIGSRNYYLYINIDGVESKEPLSKHGLRATPLSIDIKGNTICYYETSDSVYLYENDRLLKSCELDQFKTHPLLTFGDSSYVVNNNAISPPLLKVGKTESYRGFDIGDIVHHGGNEGSYWLIQKTGYRRYNLIVNHKQYDVSKAVDFESELYRNLTYYFRLTDDFFVYYTLEGSNMYRYKISL